MDDLILRSLRSENSDVEERMLSNWRRESPENERRYRQLSTLWAVAPSALPPGAPPPRPALDGILGKAREHRRAAIPIHRRIPAHYRVILRRSAAAAAILVIGYILGGFWSDGSTGTFAAVEFATGSTETATTSLTDGTVVRLAPNTRIRFSPLSTKREAWLDGRAYFAVKSDSAHPFIVHTRAGDAVALGTSFEVKVEEDDLRLAVIDGRVALAAGRERVEVEAGEVSYVQDGGSPAVVAVENVRDLLHWPGGLLVFQSTPLSQVARELERVYDTRVEIANAAVAGRVVTGWFADESLQEVITAVCRATASRCVIESERVVIAP